MTGTFSNGTGEEKLSSTQDQQQQRPQEHERKDCRPLAPNPVAALIRRGAEEVGRLQGTRRATTKVQRMINSLQWRQAQSQDDLYHLKLESGAVLRLRQIQAGEITGLGTGVTVWPAAHVLAKYLELKFGEGGMKGFRTVDLGSGTGVAGIVAAALGAEAFLTDQEQLLFLMKENADRWAQDSLDHTKDIAMGPVAATDLSAIAARDKVHVQTYHWGMDDDALSPPVDIVLVSDCVLPKLYPIEPLVNAIHRLSGPDTVTIMSYEHRHYQAFDPRWKFRELAAERGLATAVVPQAKLHPIFSTDDIEIWEVRRHRAMPKDGAESRAIPKPTETSVDKPGARRESRAEVKVEKAENICEEGLIINGQPVPSERGDATKGELNVTATVLGERHELAQSPSGPIGCYLWPSAVVMARHLLAARAGPARNADDGKEVTKPVYPSRAKVLELGSGVGLVSIVAALLGWDIVSTDKANALPLLEANVRRCLSSTKRELMVVSWTVRIYLKVCPNVKSKCEVCRYLLLHPAPEEGRSREGVLITGHCPSHDRGDNTPFRSDTHTFRDFCDRIPTVFRGSSCLVRAEIHMSFP